MKLVHAGLEKGMGFLWQGGKAGLLPGTPNAFREHGPRVVMYLRLRLREGPHERGESPGRVPVPMTDDDPADPAPRPRQPFRIAEGCPVGSRIEDEDAVRCLQQVAQVVLRLEIRSISLGNHEQGWA